MKYVCILVLFLFSLTSVHETALAQELSKKEKKRLKKEQKKHLKELKSMSAGDFQKMQQAQEEWKEKAATLDTEVANLQSQLNGKDDETKRLRDQVRSLEAELQKAKSEMAANKPVDQNVPLSNAYDEGLIFRVQIGAFRDKNLEQYLHTSEDFNGETDNQGIQKYTLGNFREYWDADKFKKYLRAMGVRDAWIVPYQDGTRVALKEVLENLQKQEPPKPQGTW